MKTKEEVINGFLERNFDLDNLTPDCKLFHRLKSDVSGVWIDGFDDGYSKGYADGSQQCGAFQRGRDEGFAQGRATAEADKTVAFQEGMDAVWEALMFLYGNDNDKDMKAFLGFKNMKDIVCNYSPATLIEKIESYKKEVEKIHVGDEVKNKNNGRTIVITRVVDDYLSGMNEEGEQYFGTDSSCWEKTGRHFDAVEELLNEIRETT